MSSLKDAIRWVVEAELGSPVGIVDLGGVLAISSLLVFSGIKIKKTYSVFLFEYKPPSIGHLIILGLILITSLVLTGYYTEPERG